MKRLARGRRILAALILAALLFALAPAALAAKQAKSPYGVDVDLTNQIVTVYAGDGRDEDDIVRQMICSAGSGGEDATPLGEFAMKQHYPEERGEWYYIKKYECYVQYPTRIHGTYMFHSLPYAEKDAATVDVQARSQLGEPVSHGCVRLRSEDAEWIAKNCPDGTVVRFYESGARNDALRTQLLRRSYVAEDWDSYQAYRSANIPAGLTGAIEAALRAQAN